MSEPLKIEAVHNRDKDGVEVHCGESFIDTLYCDSPHIAREVARRINNAEKLADACEASRRLVDDLIQLYESMGEWHTLSKFRGLQEQIDAALALYRATKGESSP